MATTEQFFNGNGSDKDFTYTFPIYQDGDIKAEVDDATVKEEVSEYKRMMGFKK